MRALPRLYSDLTRPYVPGLVVHEYVRRAENRVLGVKVFAALAARLAHLATYR